MADTTLIYETCLPRKMNRWLTSLASIVVLVFASGCEIVSNNSDGDTPAGFTEFGDPYTLIARTLFGTGDLMPNLAGNVINVRVQYSGGCEDHTFDLNYRLRQENTIAELWVQHDANGDGCEALITNELRYILPDEVSDSATIIFIGPDDFEDILKQPQTGNSN